MIQYTNSYSTPPTQIQNIVANDVSLLELYVLMQTGENEWTAQIYQMGTAKTRQIKFTKTSSNYNSAYSVQRTEDINFESVVSNEYYIYSNMGYGNSLDLPVYDGVQSFSLMIIACILMFAVVFKGALFKCLKRKR